MLLRLKSFTKLFFLGVIPITLMLFAYWFFYSVKPFVDTSDNINSSYYDNTLGAYALRKANITAIKQQDNNSLNSLNSKRVGAIRVERIILKKRFIEKTEVAVTNSTQVLEQKGNERNPVTFQSLKLGQTVIVVPKDGVILESYPAQTTASQIIILK